MGDVDGVSEEAYPKVLHVDDDETDRRIVNRLLRNEGWPDERVLQMAHLNGADEIGHFAPDVVLLDLNLAKTAGLQTLQLLRDILTRTPVVVLTGRMDQGLGEAAIQLGADNFLVKDGLEGQGLARALRFAVIRHETMMAGEDPPRLNEVIRLRIEALEKQGS